MKELNSLLPEQISSSVRLALSEDIGDGDVTSNAIIPLEQKSRGTFLVKADGVVAGLEIVKTTFNIVDTHISFEAFVNDGDKIKRGDQIAVVYGPTRSILTGERVALNYLQRMSGIATATRKLVEAIAPYNAKLLDTRKTVPGLRVFDRMAVRAGGGENHRFGLFDMVLIKDNHIVAAGGVTKAVEKVRANNPKSVPVEVEVNTISQLEEAIALKPDRILLDNMDVLTMRKAVVLTAGRVPLEASGGVTIENIHDIAATGVDYISTGSTTHSVKALDISLELSN